MEQVFKNKNVVVAGGSSGIGLAAAKRFKEAQAKVTITGRNAEKLERLRLEEFLTAAVDSRDRQALDEFFQAQVPIDHLIISLSGSKGMGTFSELSLQVLREGFEEKFWPVLQTVQAALPYLAENGSVILVTAISGIAKLAGTSGLGAINGGLEIIVQVVAKELSPIRINAVSPGVIDTEWWHFLSEDARQEQFRQLTQNIPAKRVGRPEEVADAILFVAGNAYMTGKVIGCDGGLS